MKYKIPSRFRNTQRKVSPRPTPLPESSPKLCPPKKKKMEKGSATIFKSDHLFVLIYLARLIMLDLSSYYALFKMASACQSQPACSSKISFSSPYDHINNQVK